MPQGCGSHCGPVARPEISGLVFARYLIGIEPIASMPPRDVVRTLAPMIALQLGR